MTPTETPTKPIAAGFRPAVEVLAVPAFTAKPTTAHLHCKCTEAQKARWEKAAKVEGTKKLTEWVTHYLDAVADRVLERSEKR
jgi:hypothetical protein